MTFRRRLVPNILETRNNMTVGLDDVELAAFNRAVEALNPHSQRDLIRYIVDGFLREHGFLTDDAYRAVLGDPLSHGEKPPYRRRARPGR